MSRTGLWLPPEGALEPNSETDDPLPYYYRRLTGGLYRRRIESGLSLLQPPYQRILEIGYGSGITLPTLSRLCSELWGVDTESVPDLVSGRLERLGVHANLHRADILGWSGADEPFDLIVAFSVLEHIADPSAVLSRIAELLTPGGTLLVGMPRVDKAMSALFAMIGYSGIEKHHVTTFREIRREAERDFVLEEAKVFPAGCPLWAGLYFNARFSRRPDGAAGSG